MEPVAASCVLDSDIVIDYLRGRPYARELLMRWSGDGLPAISVVTHFEVYQGMRPAEEEATNIFLGGLPSITVEASLSRQAGILAREARQQGRTVAAADAFIAATALSLGVPLLTNNADHYPFPNLDLVRGYQP